MKKTLITLLAVAIAAPAAALALRAQADPAPPPATHEVRMVMEGTSARFEPANLTIRGGDRIRFTTVSGGPHNVAFDPARVADAARARLSAGMPGQIQPLSGALVINAGDSYTMTFDGVPAGRYEYYCMPHMGMNMKGVITVQ
ncbi:plastocyanin/azurin family copper-binding protein [Longimicrobium sp.]|uniref:plastocyanin/azurin family copper-binding protein n=1 Tax=Longimicrobium sp. TaxID=2029185 RepID=UPI003B3B8DB3